MNSFKFLLGLLFFSTTSLRAQILFDYPSYPDYNLHYKHLNLKIEINADRINGVAAYDVSAIWDSTYTTFMHASKMEIVSVSLDKEIALYKSSGDSLLIEFQKPVPLNKTAKLEIVYKAESDYGIHRDELGNRWSSMLPFAISHYLPGYIHPRTILTAEIEVLSSGSDNFSLIAPGIKTAKGWTIKKPVPITDLALVFGNFRSEEIRFGFKTIRLFYNEGVVSRDEISQILETAHATMRVLENRFSLEYPFEALTLVVLLDQRWETKQSVAGLGYLFKNGADLLLQTKRIVASQWIGAFKRIEQWEDAFPEIAHIALLIKDLNGFDREKTSNDFPQPQSIWNVYSSDYLYGLSQELDRYPEFKKTLQNSESHLLKNSLSVLTEEDYRRIWYSTAYRSFSKIELTNESENERQSKRKTDTLFITINEDLKNEKISFIITAPDTLIVRPLHIVLNESERIDWFPFTQNKMKTIDWKSEISMIDVISYNEDAIFLVIDKPLDFWINQLRKAKSVHSRREAVYKIIEQITNLDIELILRDAIGRESDLEFKGQLITMLGDILNGGLGTDQTFLNYFYQEGDHVKIGAIKSFKYYPSNEAMIATLKSILRQDGSAELKFEALKSLAQIDSKENFLTLINQQLEKALKGSDIISYLTIFKELEYIEQIQILGNQTLSPDYPFTVRKTAFLSVLDVSDNEKKLKVIKKMLSDNDPRLRYIAVEQFRTYFPNEFQIQWEALMQEEFDLRIVQKLISIE